MFETPGSIQKWKSASRCDQCTGKISPH